MTRSDYSLITGLNTDLGREPERGPAASDEDWREATQMLSEIAARSGVEIAELHQRTFGKLSRITPQDAEELGHLGWPEAVERPETAAAVIEWNVQNSADDTVETELRVLSRDEARRVYGESLTGGLDGCWRARNGSAAIKAEALENLTALLAKRGWRS